MAETRHDLDALIKKAVARFNSLSPEEQEAELRAQRESWVRGEMAMERIERSETSMMMPSDTPRDRDAERLVTLRKRHPGTRPAERSCDYCFLFDQIDSRDAELREAEARGDAAGYKRGIEDAAKKCEILRNSERETPTTGSFALYAMAHELRALAETGGKRG